ncbi:MAG TPA: DUF5692 family protein, partial [Spirochaetota bacterium]|nr:DUF5692 family protein [Spirochaetota bacterium]
SSLALAANVGVCIYQLYTIITKRRNPLKEEIYTDLTAYKAVASAK